jgi:hypothetical protein
MANVILTDQEWKLVRELLEREQAQLAVEIHHSRTGSFKRALRERYDLASGILTRARASDPPDAARSGDLRP